MSTHPLTRNGGYWKPALDTLPDSAADDGAREQRGSQTALRDDLCQSCGAEFIVDSPYCRMCGSARNGEAHAHEIRLSGAHGRLHERLGLTAPATVCFVLGLAFALAALLTGFIYTTSTFTDWQAVQSWRAEWLLAAGMTFVCGILLNGRRAL